MQSYISYTYNIKRLIQKNEPHLKVKRGSFLEYKALVWVNTFLGIATFPV